MELVEGAVDLGADTSDHPVAAALYMEHFVMAEKTPQSGGEMGWILETNEAMNRAMEAMGGRIVKRYRVYELAL